jgi:hypothetical protein
MGIAPASEYSEALQTHLLELIGSSAVLMRALRVVQAVAPPDWLIGGEVVRDFVWDRLHGAEEMASPDVDLAFFDPRSLGGVRELSVGMSVTSLAPEFTWHVTNEAAAHLWYPQVHGVEIAPFTCSADALATAPETATAVAVRLLEDQSIELLAPFGLDDLFALVARRNPCCPIYGRCCRGEQSTQFAERWPRARILDSLDGEARG